MSEGILIIGPSGSGKTTGIRNLNPLETFIIAPDRKPLPIPGWRSKYKPMDKDNPNGNYLETYNTNNIINTLQYISEKRLEIKSVFIDTINHVMTAKFMADVKKKGYDKFNDLASDIYNIITLIPMLREDLKVFVTGHADISIDADGSKQVKLRSIGKMLDDKIDIPSLFTIVLFTKVIRKDNKNEYTFMTQGDGYTCGKSPMGMFEDFEIPNDYKLVIEKIDKYNKGE